MLPSQFSTLASAHLLSAPVRWNRYSDGFFLPILKEREQRATRPRDEIQMMKMTDDNWSKVPFWLLQNPPFMNIIVALLSSSSQPASQHGIIARPANPPVVVLLRTTISYVPYVRKMENQGEIIRLTNQAGWQQYGVWEARDVSITRHQQTPCIWFNYLTFALAVLASPNTDLATPDSRCEFSSFSLYLMGGWLHGGRTLDSLYRLIQSGIKYKFKYE